MRWGPLGHRGCRHRHCRRHHPRVSLGKVRLTSSRPQFPYPLGVRKEKGERNKSMMNRVYTGASILRTSGRPICLVTEGPVSYNFSSVSLDFPWSLLGFSLIESFHRCMSTNIWGPELGHDPYTARLGFVVWFPILLTETVFVLFLDSSMFPNLLS